MTQHYKRQRDEDTRTPSATMTAQDTPDRPLRYVATFQAEAWVRAFAVGVDPEGPTEWDCTRLLSAPPVRLQSYLDDLREKAEEGPVEDTYDALKKDPQAPAWVRAWHGPFTITVGARPAGTQSGPLDEDHAEASPEPIALRPSDENAKESLGEASDQIGDALHDSVEGSIREAMNDALDAATTLADRRGLGDVASEIRHLKDVRS